MQNIETYELGFHRNNKRLWLNNKMLLDNGFYPGASVSRKYDEQLVCIEVSANLETGTVVTNSHKGPIIDLNNRDFSQAFKDVDAVSVTYEPNKITIKTQHHESQIARREALLKSRIAKKEPLKMGGLYVGLGLLCRSVHRGLKRATCSTSRSVRP